MGSMNPHCLPFLLGRSLLLDLKPVTQDYWQMQNLREIFPNSRYHAFHCVCPPHPPQSLATRKKKYTFLCILCSLLDLTWNRTLGPGSMWILRVLSVCFSQVAQLKKALQMTSATATASNLWPPLSRSSWIPLWVTFSIHQHTTAKVYIWCSSRLWLEAFNIFFQSPLGESKKSSHHT